MNFKNLFFKTKNISVPPCLASYESSMANGENLYLDADDFADIVNYYTTNELYTEATQAAKIGLNIHPDNLDIQLELAYALLYNYKIEDAYDLAKELLNTEVNNNTLLLNAEVLLQSDIPKARQRAEVLLEKLDKPNSIDTIIDLCYAISNFGTLEQRVNFQKHLKKGLLKYGDHVEFLEAYVEYYKSLNRIVKAKKAINTLIDADPYDPYYWCLMAMVHFEENDYEKSNEALEFALINSQDPASIYMGQAILLLKEKKIDKAIEYFNLSYDTDHTFITQAYIGLAECYYDLGEYEKAQDLFKKAVIKSVQESTKIKNKVTDSLTSIELEVNKEIYKNVTEKDILEDYDTFNAIEKESFLNYKEEDFLNSLDEFLEEIPEEHPDPVDKLIQFYNSKPKKDCHDDDNLIHAINAIRKNKHEIALKYALKAESTVQSANAMYTLAHLFAELEQIELSFKVLEKMYHQYRNINNILLDILAYCILTFNLPLYLKYIKECQTKYDLDLLPIDYLIMQAEYSNKSGIMKFIKKCQDTHSESINY